MSRSGYSDDGDPLPGSDEALADEARAKAEITFAPDAAPPPASSEVVAAVKEVLNAAWTLLDNGETDENGTTFQETDIQRLSTALDAVEAFTKDTRSVAEAFDMALAALAAAAPPPASSEPDMRRICEALGFDPTNHHNAAKCPYCTPAPPPASSAEPDEIDWSDVKPPPCTKCGGSAVLHSYFRPDSAEVWRVTCERCGRTTGEEFFAETAHERWLALPLAAPPPASSEPADWSDLPRDLYVTSVRRLDNVVWEATVCSVPMAIGPEVRYSRAAPPPASSVPVAFPNMTGHGDLVAVPAGLLSGNPAHWKMRCVDCGKEHQAAAPPPASGEVGEMVERLKEEAGRLQTRAYGDRCVSPDCALASNLAGQAADILARVAAERDAHVHECDRLQTKACGAVDAARAAERRATAAEAALEKAREALRLWDEAFTVGTNDAICFAHEAARAALAAMEAGDE